MRRLGLLLMVSAVIASAARLQRLHVAGPVSVVNILTTGVLAALLPIAYGIGLRRWLGAHIAHHLAVATFRLLLRGRDGGAIALEVHAPLLPTESVLAGDLLRWGLGNDDSWWQRFTLRAEVLASYAVLTGLVLGGPALCITAGLRAAAPWGLLGALLGGLLTLTALRPLLAAGGVAPHEGSRP